MKKKVLLMAKHLLLSNLVAVGLVTSVLSAGAAYAFLSGSGTGSGSGTAGTLQTVSLIAVTGTPKSPLQPGSTGDVLLDLNNPNTLGVTLVSVVGNGAITVSGSAGCTAANSGVTFTDQSSLAVAIPGHSSGYPVELPGAASMSYSSESACQGATFYIPVTITVHS